MTRRYTQAMLPQPGEIRKLRYGSDFRIPKGRGLFFVSSGEIVTILRSSLYRPAQSEHRAISTTVEILHEGRLLYWSGKASLCFQLFQILSDEIPCP